VNAHPLLAVEGLGLATPAGPVFADLSFTVPRGALTAVVGPSGSGRSAVLLALGGRMRGVTGTVRLGERAARSRPRDLRAHTAVARLATLVEPEGRLTVGESVTERALVDGVAADAAARAVARAEETVGTTFDRSLLVDDLSAYDRALLCVALALVRPADLVLLDDADRALDVADQRRLLDALGRLCATGQTVVVSTTEAASLPPGTVVVPLRPRPPADPAPAVPTPVPPSAEKTS
jgi:ABC-2 type transport system ATP-binding protein